MNAIDKISTELDEFLSMPIRQYPQIKAMGILTDYFYQYKLPIKYIGKICIDIDESFFEDEKKADQVIMKFALSLMNIYHLISSEYGEDAEHIFGDLMSSMGITCRK